MRLQNLVVAILTIPLCSFVASSQAVPAATDAGVRVRRLSRQDEGFVIDAGSLRFEAQNVVVAMANYQKPRRPIFANSPMSCRVSF